MKKTVLKKAYVAIVIMFMAIAPLSAQVFLQPQGNDISPRNTSGTSEKEWIIVPVQGYDIDQYAYTPVGGGAVLLLGMAAAYGLCSAARRRHGTSHTDKTPRRKA